LAAPGRWRRRLRDKRVLVVVVLALVVLLAGSVTLSLAVFTDSSESTAAISAGDLVYDLAPTTAIVDTSGMKPGDTRGGVVTVTNRKSSGRFTLGFSGIGSGTLASTLQLTVKKTSGTTSLTLYSGPLASVPTLDLGSIATAGSATLNFTYAWPADAKDPALQGQSIPLVLEWSART
jgi:hypothetical protein